jgi:xanthine dehydrogenase accessory factor
MFDDLLEKVIALKSQDKPFVLATVVACRPPTSAKPGAKAIVQADGSFHGWVGGSCAQPLVIQESLKVLKEGQAQVMLLSPHPEEIELGLEGIVPIPMTCQSEGTLAIYLEPFLPKPQLLVIGNSPMARSLVAQGSGLGFRVSACDPAASKELFPDADSLVQDLAAVEGSIGPRSHVVVATMGHYDEEALEAVVSSPAGYIGLVASPRRGRAVMDYLQGKGVPPEALQRVKYPAGLDVGAETPEEIALSILTEVVQKMRAAGGGIALEAVAETVLETGAATALDPICKMMVNTADSRYLTIYQDETYYFCCLGCLAEFEKEPERYASQSAD